MKTLMFRFLNHDSVIIDEKNTKITFLYKADLTLQNVKLAIKGSINELMSLYNDLNILTGVCTGVYINNSKLAGITNIDNFNPGDTTMVVDISSVPIFQKENTDIKESDSFYLNIDYYVRLTP